MRTLLQTRQFVQLSKTQRFLKIYTFILSKIMKNTRRISLLHKKLLRSLTQLTF